MSIDEEFEAAIAIRTLLAESRPSATADITPARQQEIWNDLIDFGILDFRRGNAERLSTLACAFVAGELGYALAPLSLTLSTLLDVAFDDGSSESRSFVGVPLFNTELTRLSTRPDEGWFFAPPQAVEVTAVTEDEQKNGLVLRSLLIATEEVLGLDRTNPIQAAAPQPPASAAPHFETVSLTAWYAHALIILAADLVGVAKSLHQQAVEYARVRVQYGRPIGGFQAIQHMLAQSETRLTAAQNFIIESASGVETSTQEESLQAARLCKAYASRECLSSVKISMQVFGGIAMTWEHPAHLHLRRVEVVRRLLGNENEQYRLLEIENGAVSGNA